MSKKWTPGQRLNSAAEVMQALLDGEKIRGDWWGKSDNYICMLDGKIQHNNGTKCDPNFNLDGWLIYTPPKRTREVTVFLNIYPDRTRAYNDPASAQVKAMCDALAVAVPHTFTIEY